jgi:hypothetical protein
MRIIANYSPTMHRMERRFAQMTDAGANVSPLEAREEEKQTRKTPSDLNG